MAELTQEERLQPALLDRLTDDHPHEKMESRTQRVLSMNKLREAVLRDLNWLLNTVSLSAIQSLDEYPEVAHSVVNFGMPELAGHTSSNLDAAVVEQVVRQAIWDFEPRILRNTLQVLVGVEREGFHHNTMTLEIRGELWAEPLPIALYVKTELDMETGDVKVTEAGRG